MPNFLDLNFCNFFVLLKFDRLLWSFHHYILNIKERTKNRFGFIVKLHIIIVNLIQLYNFYKLAPAYPAQLSKLVWSMLGNQLFKILTKQINQVKNKTKNRQTFFLTFMSNSSNIVSAIQISRHKCPVFWILRKRLQYHRYFQYLQYY